MFSNDRNIETIGQLVEVLKHYIGLQSEYVKLDMAEKVVRLLTVATITVVISVLLMLTLIYFSFALAYALEPSMGLPWAFCVVGGVYLLVLILCVIFRHRWIERPLVHFLASLLMEK
ncbi:phage holin family protein [Prevotella sp. KH2C16]|uniref:phage holin family protein n=1 Tax=Prevotella sp. KH2C16 TaxID=1855325 RepID=UPI0008E9E543|nr:phage holin family protein [Prevotella sp. KH2C16]SFG20764.1 Putative Holin-X, holin superfamily III [Prevotella sp. KH2C16]